PDEAVRVARGAGVDPGGVLGLVAVADDVAAIVAGLLEQPREHPLGVIGVGDPRLGALAVDAEHIVARDRAPVRIAGGMVGPALDPREQALDARPKPLHAVVAAVREVEPRTVRNPDRD